MIVLIQQQYATDWVPYKQQKCISHCSPNQESEIRMPAWSDESPLQGRKRRIVFLHC